MITTILLILYFVGVAFNIALWFFAASAFESFRNITTKEKIEMFFASLLSWAFIFYLYRNYFK